MDKSKKYLAISFIVVLIAVIILSFVGMFLLKDKPVILQGQIEATEIRISGKLPGRIDTFLVKEGQNVKAGDTLVVINSPEALAKYQQVNALEVSPVSKPEGRRGNAQADHCHCPAALEQIEVGPRTGKDHLQPY